MKTVHFTICLMTVAVLLSATILLAAPATQPSTQPAPHALNKMCMVESDHRVDPAFTYLYNGKAYGFCCQDCVDEFKKSPEQFISAAK